MTDLNVANTVKEIRRALIDADVNFKIAKEFTDKVREKGGQTVSEVSGAPVLRGELRDSEALRARLPAGRTGLARRARRTLRVLVPLLPVSLAGAVVVRGDDSNHRPALSSAPSPTVS